MRTTNVDAAVAEMVRKIEAVAEEVRVTRVIPSCPRLGATFNSGMGTFSFHLDRHPYVIDSDKKNRYKLRALFETLDIEVDYQNSLGHFMNGVDKEDL